VAGRWRLAWLSSGIDDTCFPPVIIAIWLSLPLTLSYRDLEDLLAARGLDISYKMVRRWGAEVRTGGRAQAAGTVAPTEKRMALG
jgi:hypothetical protein